jgi:hypothetical protein
VLAASGQCRDTYESQPASKSWQQQQHLQEQDPEYLISSSDLVSWAEHAWLADTDSCQEQTAETLEAAAAAMAAPAAAVCNTEIAGGCFCINENGKKIKLDVLGRVVDGASVLCFANGSREGHQQYKCHIQQQHQMQKQLVHREQDSTPPLDEASADCCLAELAQLQEYALTLLAEAQHQHDHLRHQQSAAQRLTSQCITATEAAAQGLEGEAAGECSWMQHAARCLMEDLSKECDGLLNSIGRTQRQLDQHQQQVHQAALDAAAAAAAAGVGDLQAAKVQPMMLNGCNLRDACQNQCEARGCSSFTAAVQNVAAAKAKQEAARQQLLLQKLLKQQAARCRHQKKHIGLEQVGVHPAWRC